MFFLSLAAPRVCLCRCASLRRVTLREEAVKRQELEEAEKAHQRAWEEYQKAFIRDEAVVILEAWRSFSSGKNYV